MRCMKRNQSKMYLSNLIGKTPIVDEWGNKTGEYELVYDKPQVFYAYVTPETKESLIRRFGVIEPYDRVLVLDNYHPLIDEQTRLWIDSSPQYEPLKHDDSQTIHVGKRKMPWRFGIPNDWFLSWDSSPGGKYINHDYMVKKISNSLNSRVVSIRKVNVSD